MGSTPLKGSSIRRNFGSAVSARVISSRLRSPPDRVNAGWSARCDKFNSSSIDCTKSLSSPFGIGRFSATANIFCLTVSFLKTEGSCGKYPIPILARLYIGTSVMSAPSRNTSPSVAGTSPTII